MIDSTTEQSKFEKIYYEYKGLMFYVTYDILHNKEDAEDAVHLAFVKIAENIEKIINPICPKTKSYVVTIAENIAIDLYRKKHRHTTIELNEEISGISVEYNGSNALTACLLKLPANYREIILLKYYHGYTSKEIAKMLRLSESNVIKIDQRAKKKLLAFCKEEEII
jgi:RNA polymerase sigma-70 factor (ECF subfamily)